MGRVPHSFPWAPHPRRPDGSQTSGVLAPTAGFEQFVQDNKKFNHLSQYGSYHADTNEKMFLFHQGCSPMLRDHLTLFQGCTMNELVSTSIEQEDMCHARLEKERKKRPLPGPTRGAPPKYLLVDTLPSSQPCAPLIAAVEPPSTSAGRPMSSSLPTAGCSTSSSAAGWHRVSMLQLWPDWALLS
jgi:hypothetical protein